MIAARPPVRARAPLLAVAVLALGAALALAPTGLAGQGVVAPPPGPRPAVVVQVAGATIYVGVGTDSGMTTGDTVTVRRAPTAVPVGSAIVVGATAARSLLAFVGAPFPVTRGDTLYLSPGVVTAQAAAARIAARPPAAPTPSRVRSEVGRPQRSTRRSYSALGVEVWGAHTDLTGAGTDPVHLARDVAIPAVRFRTSVSDEASSYDLNLRAEHRTGPTTVFDRQAVLRVHSARYDRRLGATEVTAGRFYSDFDHASGFWDGVRLRVGDRSGSYAGVAAGFEPEWGNERFSTEIPKAALFAGTSRSTSRADLSTEIAFHRTFAPAYSRQRQAIDWSLALRIGRYGITQELEASPPTLNGTWGFSRHIVRGTAAFGATELYGAAVSDRPLTFDTAWTGLPERRERVSAGLNWRSPGGAFVDVNAAVSGPRDPASGVSTGAMASIPDLFAGATLLVSGSYFRGDGSRGLTFSPSVEHRFGDSRVRGGYQYFRAEGTADPYVTHGVDARYALSFGGRMELVVQVSGRLGQHARSMSVFTSLERRF